MDATQCKDLFQSLQCALSRRSLLPLGIAGGLAAFGPAGSEAKKKRKKKRKKKDSAPVPVVTYQCSGAVELALDSGGGNPRFAQRFVTAQGGQLRQISSPITKTGGTGDFILQLVLVTGSPDGTPSHSPVDVLATTTIPNSSVPMGISTLVADFAGPELAEGVEYAAIVSRRGNTFTPHLRTGCEGQLYFADGGNAFAPPLVFEDGDLLVSVLVA